MRSVPLHLEKNISQTSHQEPEPPPLPVWDLPGIDLESLLLLKLWFGSCLSLAAAKPNGLTRANQSLAAAEPELGSCQAAISGEVCLSHRTSKRTYNKTFHQEPEPPPLPVWKLQGLDLSDPSLHVKFADGYSKMDFMPNAFTHRFCKDPRCYYLASDKWDFCCGKCQYYYDEYGFNPDKPKKKHCKRCWRVYVKLLD